MPAESPPVHTHSEPGEQCILPNQAPVPSEPPAPRREEPSRQPQRPAAGTRSRRGSLSGRTVLASLAVIFALAALSSLWAVVTRGDRSALGGLLGSGILAALFYRLFRLPPGARQVTDRTGKAVPVGLYVLARVVVAILVWYLLGVRL